MEIVKTLRLVKLVVHPILVVDDGETLTEFPNQPSAIAAADWDGYPERLKADIADAERQLNDEMTAKATAKERQ